MAQAHRLQIYLPNELYFQLKARTQQAGESLAGFIRDAVEQALRRKPVDWKNDPIMKMIGAGGKGSGITDMSDNDKIDEVLYGPILVRDAPSASGVAPASAPYLTPRSRRPRSR